MQNMLSLDRSLQQQPGDSPTIWIPPTDGIIKINVDITFRNPETAVGIGYILRDSAGNFISAGTKSANAGTSEQAECWGIHAAIQEGVRCNLKHVQIESDNKAAVDYLQGKPTNLFWSSSFILDEAKLLSSFFGSVSFSFCCRTGNDIAHNLASEADLSSSVAHIYNRPPFWMLSMLSKDLLFCNMLNS
ncbi:hypothetical protein FRX31_024546 [Thalictrum thalictroides]|uniref:RNase H type-1 domain-containing protein n=1 Tax=Thalictrum thalictroides TaxID=46969 RepID=A0A7J6VL54_THATH|nr:hypothetical protein FRX31_024546 [Thalictrum thalictroides]